MQLSRVTLGDCSIESESLTDGDGPFLDFLVEHFAQFTAERGWSWFNGKDLFHGLLGDAFRFTIQQASIDIDLRFQCDIARRRKVAAAAARRLSNSLKRTFEGSCRFLPSNVECHPERDSSLCSSTRSRPAVARERSCILLLICPAGLAGP